jgi:hypothetical protein
MGLVPTAKLVAGANEGWAACARAGKAGQRSPTITIAARVAATITVSDPRK